MSDWKNIETLALQPEPWGSPLSYTKTFANNVNVISSIARCLPKKEFEVDRVRVLTQDTGESGVDASPYNDMAVADVTLSDYDLAYRDISMKMIASGNAIPTNKERDLRNAKIGIFEFDLEAHLDAVRGEVERQLVLGDSGIDPLEDDGFLSSNTPRQTHTLLAADNSSALNRLSALDEVSESITTGAGGNGAMIAFMHTRTRRKIVRDVRVTGASVESMLLPPLGRRVPVYEASSGPIYLVPSDFFPITDDKTSIIFAAIGGDLGIQLGVPAGTPEPHESAERDILRPQGITLVEYKRALLVMDDGKLAEAADYDLTGAD